MRSECNSGLRRGRCARYDFNALVILAIRIYERKESLEAIRDYSVRHQRIESRELRKRVRLKVAETLIGTTLGVV